MFKPLVLLSDFSKSNQLTKILGFRILDVGFLLLKSFGCKTFKAYRPFTEKKVISCQVIRIPEGKRDPEMAEGKVWE